MKKKILVLLSGAFPFQTGEEFLVEETEYYKVFEKAYVIPVEAYTYEKQKDYNSQNCEIIRINNGRPSVQRKFIGCIGALLKKEVWKELAFLLRTKRLNVASLRQLLVYEYEYCEKLNKVDRALQEIFNEQKISQGENIILYSYWMSINVKIAIALKKKYPKLKIVTRCHGGDIYEYRYKSDYLPFRREILSIVDCVFPISQNGHDYLCQRYPEHSSPISVARLGTKEVMSAPYVECSRDVLRVVSCSYCRPLKRIHLIIEALAQIEDLPVKWVHYGAGDELKKLKELAQSSLGKNVDFEFKGYVDNSEIIRQYISEQYSVFINVSETEGIPVSIMEALSCSIPIIATDVGGVSEMINHEKNGYLLSVDFQTKELAERIATIATMETKRYQNMRSAAFDMWNERFNSRKNYERFMEALTSLE